MLRRYGFLCLWLPLLTQCSSVDWYEVFASGETERIGAALDGGADINRACRTIHYEGSTFIMSTCIVFWLLFNPTAARQMAVVAKILRNGGMVISFFLAQLFQICQTTFHDAISAGIYGFIYPASINFK